VTVIRSRKGDCPSSDDLVGYALGALDPGEQRTVATHVDGCERCSRELTELAPAVGVLAESVEQLEPPPTLRQSLMAAVHADAGDGIAAKKSAPARRGRARAFLWRPVAALGAIALVAAGAIGYLARDAGDSSGVEEVALASPLPGAGGTIEIEGDAATLHAHGMPKLARGAVYQIWVSDGGQVSPSGAFVPHQDGTATAAVPEAAEGADQVLVTREPRAGMTGPTSSSVLGGKL
jgi:Anti-sigma-K factor rskA, C-terminal